MPTDLQPIERTVRSLSGSARRSRTTRAVHETEHADRPRSLRAAPPRRSSWRQRLIDAETGLRLGIRTDGTFFVHLFVGCGLLATAMVLELGAVQWAVLVLAMTFVLSAEMFNQMLRVLWKDAAHHLPPEVRNAVRIGTAAVVLSSVGAVITIAIVFAQRLLSTGGG